ncbi:ArsR family transcriptional regulator [Corynebacterium suedekumii]|uniref:ArsR family transcriptional regulator n=1 Tax=Corynebacterium suedekumii TaxID=3049801 RepID=A0ABY8VRN9_9CORY|nr:ArsR family transcriptional regulator [Corynebacterium suedekumii]WIM71612.1 ArsR family transcriptional regulator [Corynebacterium suedekumii]
MPTHKEIMAETELSKRSVAYHLAALRKAGLISD